MLTYPLRKINYSILSLITLFVICILTAIFPEQFSIVLNFLHRNLLSRLGFLYPWMTGFILIFALVASFTSMGKTKLGDTKKYIPNHKYYALIFSTGMGVSMIYWGVLEPNHHVDYGMTEGWALSWTFFNWGINAWSYYFAIAVFVLLMRAIDLFQNNAVKSVLVFTTVAGLALSLIYSIDGIRLAPDIPIIQSKYFPYLLIGSLSILSYISVRFGILKGMSNFSLVNMSIAFFLVGWVIINTPQFSQIMRFFFKDGSIYILNIPRMTFSQPEKTEWMITWPYTYYASWIAWSLFVGNFLARISHGRSLRNIAFSILIVPMLFSMLWFSSFAAASFQTGAKDLFELLANFPAFTAMKYMSLLSLALFFVTSQDSGSHVLHKIEPKIGQGGWIIMMAILALVVLNLPGDSVRNILTLVAIFSFPLLLIMGYIVYRLYAILFATVRADLRKPAEQQES